jgi:hypothetical protein
MERLGSNERGRVERVAVVDSKTLSKRLSEISKDTIFEEQLYPSLAQLAGWELPPVAIAGAVSLVVDRITRGDRDQPTSQLLRLFVPHIVDAMIEDPDRRQIVKRELGLSI